MKKAKVALVGCGKAKLARAAPARELYTSTLFRLAARYADLAYDRWFILSAKYGVVEPCEVIEPYERVLGAVHEDCFRLGSLVNAQLIGHGVLPSNSELHVLAGRDYADAVALFRPVDCCLMAGLQIGERAAWLKAKIAELEGEGRGRGVDDGVRQVSVFEDDGEPD